MQPKQTDPLVLQDDSTACNGAERPVTQPTLWVVPPATPSITPRIEIDFKQLDDGRVVELIEDPNDPTKTKLAVFEAGKVSVVDEVDYHGQILVPLGRTGGGLADVILTAGSPTVSDSRRAV